MAQQILNFLEIPILLAYFYLVWVADKSANIGLDW